MADAKISAFNALTGANVDTAADVMAIVDTGSTETKKITVAELAAAVTATQAQQETGTATTVFVTPGRQHYHTSAAKFWIKCNPSGSIQGSYNVTSITDGGVGILTVTIATDFSSDAYCAQASAVIANTGAFFLAVDGTVAPAAGSIQIRCKDSATNLQDPDFWFVSGFGDQA